MMDCNELKVLRFRFSAVHGFAGLTVANARLEPVNLQNP